MGVAPLRALVGTGNSRVTGQRWTLEGLRQELGRFERDPGAAGLADASEA